MSCRWIGLLLAIGAACAPAYTQTVTVLEHNGYEYGDDYIV